MDEAPFDPFASPRQKAKKRRKTCQEGGDEVPTTKKKDDQASPRKSAAIPALDRGQGPSSLPSRCCLCQMPLSLLTRLESATVHQSCCLEVSFDRLPPCPVGGDCDSTVPRHYRCFSHFRLAAGREEGREEEKGREAEEHWGSFGATVVEADEGERPGGGGGRDVAVVDEDEAATAKSPVKVTADVDSRELKVRLEVVDPSVQLAGFQMRIPADDMTRPIACSSVVTKKREEGNVLSRSDASKAWKDIFGRRQAKGARGDGAPVEAKERGGRSHYGPRKCPFYKRIPNTPFVVDAFSYGASVPGVTKYFLSHFHYDHFRGLGKNFAHTIVCSCVTARLVRMRLKVNPSRILALQLNEPRVIDQVEVTLLDANHCPGAVMFLFKSAGGRTYLHCGDFRATALMEEYPELWDCQVDKVFLDTTYCKPEYDFPDQSDVVATCVESVKKLLRRHPKTLILVGSYTIGKERVFSSLAEELDCKVWASEEKVRILKALDDSVIKSRLTTNSHLAQIHVVDMGKTKNRRDLKQYMELLGPGCYDHILAISPTGWTHSRGSTAEESLAAMAIKTYGSVSSFDVPYSEHSSFSELRRFVKFLKLQSADCVVPTVNVGRPEEREAMRQLFTIWVNDENRVSTYLSRNNDNKEVPRRQ